MIRFFVVQKRMSRQSAISNFFQLLICASTAKAEVLYYFAPTTKAVVSGISFFRLGEGEGKRKA
jgi:hypothetical protein